MSGLCRANRGNNNWFAAYAYWVLRLRGFAKVKLLDGGRKKWEMEGRDMSQQVIDYRRTGFTMTGQENPQFRALRGEVLERLGVLRPPGRRTVPGGVPGREAGAPSPAPGAGTGAGHIPGAANVPWAQAANEDGTFKSADDLKELYARKGITPDREIIAYCRIGERSSHTWFALHELLGYPDVKNYDGSWTEYDSPVRAPVEMG
ncbi:sulfurtransferase [Streptomyces lunaelactis]|uniref:sulfurtransferase n=1 Tax=Streptomyces lunaelactis TaxID=1535768 RepID=UPI001C2FD8BC|nr:rhodanese-like domain-containing protein [Streptomyces lunaelactis]